ncbi:MAG: DNA replication/repair protein RecF [Clostridia bacterium]|nr:DNA replication/repair protein RecF [Clostridia bacterium]
MICKEISFSNFRNIEEERVSFSDGINVLWGKNAQGKSNVLEAVYYFARGRSFRGAHDRDMIKFGSDFARISSKCYRGNSEYPTELEVVIDASDAVKKRVFRNGAAASGMGEIIGSFRAVLFCPANLSLVSGPPAGRRAFLDIAISQLSKEYMSCLADYKRVLQQRNAALRAAAKGDVMPRELWETYASQMSYAASRISSYRLDYLSMLSSKMNVIFNDMTHGSETPSLSYVSHSFKKDGGYDDEDGLERGEVEAAGASSFGDAKIDADCLVEHLTSNIDREIKNGATLWGPHKDDIRIKLNGRDAKTFASQGQLRSLALSMKLSEGEISNVITGDAPVMLLDDVLSELDRDRRDFVLGAIVGRQIIVTSCEPSLFDSAGAADLLKVEAGRITRM